MRRARRISPMRLQAYAKKQRGIEVMNSILVGAIFWLATAVVSTSASAATFDVNSLLDQQDATPGNGACATAASTCTLRAAITEANALAGADIIRLPAGTFTTTRVGVDDSNSNGDYDLTSEITLVGAGSATTIIQAAPTAGIAVERVFHLLTAFPIRMKDLTVRHGREPTATFGGGIRINTSGAVTTFNNVVIADNFSGLAGGGLTINAPNSTTTLDNCRVEGNSIATNGTNSAAGAGILVNSATATVNINDSTIIGNAASSISTSGGVSGGGISTIGILNLNNSTVSNNTVSSTSVTTFSGGIHVTGGTTTIVGSTIANNASTATGGLVSGFAGGIYNQQATVVITDSVVSGNTASNFHGGIRALASTNPAVTTITNSTISNNSASGEGGGLVNFSVGIGDATMTINGSTVSGNASNGESGGLENFSSGAGIALIDFTNSTLSGNSAANRAGSSNTGASSKINFNFATVANNTATAGAGGIFQGSTGTTNLKNSIVADNAAPTGADISGTVTSFGYNHIESVSGGTFVAVGGDITGTDPQLWALANNGGNTLTHLPAPSSAVVDSIPSGSSGCGGAVITSQNGVNRPTAAGCEKGSTEIGESTLFRDGFDGF